MASYKLSRADVESLAERLLNRANSPLLNDMPETQRDIRLAALFMSHVAALGMPIGTIILGTNGNGA